MSINSTNDQSSSPALHVRRLFSVRVSREGVPSYKYTARARHAFDAWEAAMDRAIAVCNTSSVFIEVEPLPKVAPVATYNF